MFIESSGLLHKHLHLLGGEGTLEHALVITSPLTELSVEFGGEVKRAVGEVGHVTEVFTVTELAMEDVVKRDAWELLWRTDGARSGRVEGLDG